MKLCMLDRESDPIHARHHIQTCYARRFEARFDSSSRPAEAASDGPTTSSSRSRFLEEDRVRGDLIAILGESLVQEMGEM